VPVGRFRSIQSKKESGKSRNRMVLGIFIVLGVVDIMISEVPRN